ncbi:LysR substrate-binding domain-containing protein [Aliamphritea hakodatensis]|uniref:LysR substrate-binding domain-containing protein n=1 Tax=Aliamphritea hakodatensis TaxID=2895352 RepID=UPI0022FD40B7|nr:LysR substrate-binding domain-containing protein [Aliamphritea hakodatensis]
MRITPLPPLNSLVVFESAARHLSFTRAADELNVTQGAISRQIRHLEDYLGRKLFIRDKRSLSLTSTGMEYYDSIQQSLLLVAGATGNILQWQGDQQVTVVTTHAMASFWLLPRFNAFQELHPDIDVRILAVDSLKDIRHNEFDIALFFCHEAPADLSATPLFAENVFPVCSPGYLEKNPHISQTEDMLKGTLLTLEVGEEWLSWQAWFRACSIEYRADAGPRMNINNYLLVIQSALNGQGLALGWENLVDDYLASGLLVKPVSTSVETTSQFLMLEPEQTARPKQGAEYFRKWLLSLI